MALNAASHNPGKLRFECRYTNYLRSNTENTAGEKTGPVSGQPPSASQETTAALLGASKDDPMGQHEGGQDRGDKDAPKKIKSEKERMYPG